MSKARTLPDPFYKDEHGQGVIYHIDAREIIADLGYSDIRSVYLDPPYSVKKAKWDMEFPHWLFSSASQLAPTMCLSPGLNNLLNCPPVLPGGMRYVWTLAAHITNGMTRGTISYANWIPGLLYGRSGYLKRESPDTRQDCKTFTVGGSGERRKADHPSPKHYSLMRWFINWLPGEEIIDFMAGSGTTLRAAKDLGKKYIGIDSNGDYCEYMARRMSQAVLFAEQNFNLDDGEIRDYVGEGA